ncbi:MAG: stage III sporulation protein AB [Halanaerobiales bacterium]|nr:stage III sporulation protein AB [Halanaerobiales bacterium]
MVKMIGSLIIILSGLIGGKLMGYQYIQRTKELQEFYIALHMLETEIAYGQVLLPNAIKKLSQITPHPHKGFFALYHQKLQTFDGLTADQTWQKVIQNSMGNFCLKAEDWEVLRQYGHALGVSNDTDQIRHLKVAQKRLEQLEMIARVEEEKMSKMWNYVGILTGIALVILLY